MTLALACSGCAVAPPPGQPLTVRAQPVPSGEFHEACGFLEADTVVAWRFVASVPVDFELNFRDGSATVAPVTRERVTEDRGRYVTLVPRTYCLSWRGGPVGAMLDYTVEVGTR